jgi:hypothetical protein
MFCGSLGTRVMTHSHIIVYIPYYICNPLYQAINIDPAVLASHVRRTPSSNSLRRWIGSVAGLLGKMRRSSFWYMFYLWTRYFPCICHKMWFSGVFNRCKIDVFWWHMFSMGLCAGSPQRLTSCRPTTGRSCVWFWGWGGWEGFSFISKMFYWWFCSVATKCGFHNLWFLQFSNQIWISVSEGFFSSMKPGSGGVNICVRFCVSELAGSRDLAMLAGVDRSCSSLLRTGVGWRPNIVNNAQWKYFMFEDNHMTCHVHI